MIRRELKTTGLNTEFLNARKDLLLSGAVLAVLLLTVFAPVLINGFVNWDDPVYIAQNPLLHLPLLTALPAFFTSFPLGNYHPLTSVGQWLEFRLFASAPFGYHLISTLTHLLNGLLLLLLLRRLSFDLPAAFFAAALFALHPMRVEAVAWISAQKDLWCAFWLLLALHAYLGYIQGQDKERKRYYLLSLAAFLLALLAKGSAMVLAPLLLIVDLLQQRRFDRRLWREKFPFFALSLIFGVIALMARSRFQGVLEEVTGFGDALGLAVYRLVFPFTLRTLLPLPHAFPAYPPDGTAGKVWLLVATTGLVLLALLGMFCWRRWRTATCGAIFFVITLLPALALPNLGYAADRFTYLASIGLAISAAALLQQYHHRAVRVRFWIMSIILVVVLLIFAWSTTRLIRTWHDSESLITEYVELYQNNPGRELYLALALETRARGRKEAGAEELAAADFAAAFRARPSRVDELINGGEWLLGEERFEEALSNFNRAQELNPASYQALVGRAMVLRRTNRFSEALAVANQALQLAPDESVVYNTRGTILQTMNRPAEALRDFSQAIALIPDAATPYINRALTYLVLGERAPAMADLESALRLDPQNLVARDWLAKVRQEE